MPSPKEKYSEHWKRHWADAALFHAVEIRTFLSENNRALSSEKEPERVRSFLLFQGRLHRHDKRS